MPLTEAFLPRAFRRLQPWGPALRAAAAVSACLAAGQLAHRTALGLVMAVGARRVVLVDPGGEPAARAANLALAALATTAAVFLGTLAGNSLPLSALGMFGLGWVAGVGRSHSEAAGKLAAAPALLFALAQLLPGGPATSAERALAVAVGCAVACLLVLDTFPAAWFRLAFRRTATGLAFLAAAARSPAAAGRFGLLLAGTVTGCLLAVRLLGVPRGSWVVVSVLLVLRPESGTTRRRGLERLLGTLVGCLLAAALVFLVRPVALVDVLIFLLMAGYFRLQPRAYGWSLAFLTPAIVLGVGLLEPGNWHWAENRGLDVVAGTLVALGVGWLLGVKPAPPPPVIG
ncbi:MAG: FUSC family protein [Myxococcaceae bacterium]